MKNLYSFLIAMVMSTTMISYVSAQDCTAFFPMEEGSVREMTSYDKKDKVTGTVIQTVKEVREDGDKMEIVVEVETLDKKGEQISMGELMFVCEEGVFKVDMRNYLDPSAMQGMEDMELVVDATDLIMPSELSAGMELPDGSIEMSASTSGMTMMNFRTYVTNRKVEGTETISTPAGTFDCYKISQDVEVKTIMSIKASSIEWVAEGVGVVKSESYNKNGKLNGYTLLTSIK